MVILESSLQQYKMVIINSGNWEVPTPLTNYYVACKNLRALISVNADSDLCKMLSDLWIGVGARVVGWPAAIFSTAPKVTWLKFFHQFISLWAKYSSKLIRFSGLQSVLCIISISGIKLTMGHRIESTMMDSLNCMRISFHHDGFVLPASEIHTQLSSPSCQTIPHAIHISSGAKRSSKATDYISKIKLSSENFYKFKYVYLTEKWKINQLFSSTGILNYYFIMRFCL